jgi:hypothetical protein
MKINYRFVSIIGTIFEWVGIVMMSVFVIAMVILKVCELFKL